ncbi:hypothetical protein CEXT_227041 [Caerostris extrusa]|uniref:Uncharacterized protein n=1 Tax=Caerostris extrusa TaxID=172846 RepID=A0AAV4NAK8_CAEEX|nr:hypothetical protein CEXT_227041 [Caerostris extrusa]
MQKAFDYLIKYALNSGKKHLSLANVVITNRVETLLLSIVVCKLSSSLIVPESPSSLNVSESSFNLFVSESPSNLIGYEWPVSLIVPV